MVNQLDVILKKEDVQTGDLAGEIVVVLDVFLATTTLSAVLDEGAEEVIAVKDAEMAKKISAKMKDGTFIMAGELDGNTIDGFEYPWPLHLKVNVKGKSVILASTNGTVAIDRSVAASHLYAASLINSKAVAQYIAEQHTGTFDITLVCAGDTGQFCLEDFIGAGLFIEHYLTYFSGGVKMTDSAVAALNFYRGQKDNLRRILTDSKVGKQLVSMGLEKDMIYACKYDISSTILEYRNGSFRNVSITKPRV
ncbi:2-phosphosulfolactate phosphatase [Thalassobacillus devorans]|uniref:2-phosphosulfolactate phosphatase n=1 Tax=Thalassobacillus devorans TaxID=279813 RepID=UPI000A1C8DFD|nr:2-phosphosulfolactate phosphatase [Thalassobacillus devorans]